MASDTAERFKDSEGGVFIGYGNVLADVGAIVGSTYSVDPTLVHDNIRYPNYDKSGRFTNWQLLPEDTTKMFLNIPVQLASPSKIGFLCMGGIQTNYPSNSYEKMKFRIFSSNSTLSDSTLSQGVEVTSEMQDLFIRNTGLDWLDNDFWFGYSKTLLRKRTVMSPYLFESSNLIRSLMIQIIVDIPEDSVLYQTNPGRVVDSTYYLDLAFLFVGQSFFFEMNYGWKTVSAPIGNPSTATIGNSVRGNYRGEFKTVDIVLPDLSESQFMYKVVRNIIANKPTFQRFIVFPKPTAIQHFYDRAMLAVMNSSADQTHEYYEGFSSSIQFRETM
jgi:hypothetical protein